MANLQDIVNVQLAVFIFVGQRDRVARELQLACNADGQIGHRLWLCRTNWHDK